MDNFKVLEYIFSRDSQWVEKINNYEGDKPLFLIINRAYITTRGKLEDNDPLFKEVRDNATQDLMVEVENENGKESTVDEGQMCEEHEEKVDGCEETDIGVGKKKKKTGNRGKRQHDKKHHGGIKHRHSEDKRGSDVMDGN